MTEKCLKEEYWNVLIVDNDIEQHQMFKLLFRNYIFLEKQISFISAYDSKEARNILKENKDIALILLDVVLETDHSGLELVNTVRNDLRNELTQIVLMTGDLGDTPETSIVMNYSINACVEKGSNDFSSAKLYCVLTSSLREYYKDLKIVRGMEILTKLRVFSDNIGRNVDLESLVNAIFNCFRNEGGIKNAALFFDGQLIKCSNNNVSELLLNRYEKWEEAFRMFTITGDYMFLVFREFTRHVFVIECVDELSKKFADNLLSQAASVRRNLIGILNNEQLISNIFHLTEEKNNIIYVKAYGDGVLVQRLTEQKLLKMPFRDISLYFEESFLLKINRSVAVNVNNVKSVNRISYRKMELLLINDELLNVSKSHIEKVEKIFC